MGPDPWTRFFWRTGLLASLAGLALSLVAYLFGASVPSVFKALDPQTPSELGKSSAIFSAATFVSPEVGFAVTTAGRIVQTKNGGASWTLAELPPSLPVPDPPGLAGIPPKKTSPVRGVTRGTDTEQNRIFAHGIASAGNASNFRVVIAGRSGSDNSHPRVATFSTQDGHWQFWDLAGWEFCSADEAAATPELGWVVIGTPNSNSLLFRIGPGPTLREVQFPSGVLAPFGIGALQDNLWIWGNTSFETTSNAGNGVVAHSSDGGESWSTVRQEGSGAIVAFDSALETAIAADGEVLRVADSGKAFSSIGRIPLNFLEGGASRGLLVSDPKGGLWFRPAREALLYSHDSFVAREVISFPSFGSVTSLGFGTDFGWGIFDGNIYKGPGFDPSAWRDPLRYGRLPGPAAMFFFAVGVLAFAGAWFRLRREKNQPPPLRPEGSIPQYYLSDKPLSSVREASRDLAALSKGLAGFISNRNTGAPLVLAITGPWGAGKSSLMNLIKADLTAQNFHPVTFNAWHHEQEQILLASLLTKIKEEAIPPAISLTGIDFYSDLAVSRYRRRWLPALLVSAVCAFALGAASMLETYPSAAELKALGGLGALGLIAMSLYALLKMLDSFGIDFRKYAVAQAAWKRPSESAELSGFRHSFAVEFGEVTQALKPQRMVVFFDDLDRCHPDQLLKVLETLNFLSVSGECFLILGVEKQTVLTMLAEKLTDRIPKAEDGKPLHTPWEFATLWLEKLVQIEVRIPDLQTADLQKLAGESSQTGVSEQEVSEAGRRSKVALVLAAVCLLGAAMTGIAIGRRLQSPSPSMPVAVAPTPTSRAEFTSQASATIQPLASGSAASLPFSISASPQVPPAPSIRLPWPWPYFGTVAFLLAVIALALLIIKNVSRILNPPREDSRTFKDAIDLWWPLIRQRLKTPRSIKRFLNRLRLLASVAEHVGDTPNSILTLHDIVGLGVLNLACPNWLGRELGILPFDSAKAEAEAGELTSLSTDARNIVLAVREHQEAPRVRRLLDMLAG